MDPLLDFTNKTAVITGAGSGFGRLLSIGLAQRGCNLVISDINIDTVKETAKMCHSKVVAIQADVSQESACKAQVDAALREFGYLDIGVNNAGVAHRLTPLHQLDETTMQSQMAVNVNGVLFGMKYQIEAMLKQGTGQILNVSSMAGIGGAPRGGAYSAAKHAVIGLTKTAAVEYAKKRIQVNAICPFFSPTNILAAEGFDSEENLQRLAQGSPSKRLPAPQEVVNLMLLTLSPGNTYMTGQALAVDGGVSAW